MKPIDRPRKIKVADLLPGMFVELPGSWLQHAFIRGSFLIRDQAQILKIKKSGLEEVVFIPSKSTIRPGVPTKPKYVAMEPQKKTWDPALMPENFSAILKDVTVSPEKKSRYIYDASLDVMNKLLAEPSVDNITQFKEGVSEMVDHILEDDETAGCLLNITSHDYYTFTHSVNVGILSILLIKALYGKSSPHDLQELGAAFFLHDIGKVNIPESLINKPGRLDAGEIQIMRDHPLNGYQILSDTDHLSPESKIIVMQHHERHGGMGYPQGLMGNEIHIYGRICSITDVFDALTSKRSYKPALPTYEALRVMKTEMIDHFSPELFAEFIGLFRK